MDIMINREQNGGYAPKKPLNMTYISWPQRVYTLEAIIPTRHSNPSIVLHALRNRLSLLLALNAPQASATHSALAINHR